MPRFASITAGFSWGWSTFSKTIMSGLSLVWKIQGYTRQLPSWNHSNSPLWGSGGISVLCLNCRRWVEYNNGWLLVGEDSQFTLYLGKIPNFTWLKPSTRWLYSELLMFHDFSSSYHPKNTMNLTKLESFSTLEIWGITEGFFMVLGNTDSRIHPNETANLMPFSILSAYCLVAQQWH